MTKVQNEMEVTFDAKSCNESFARVCVAAFISQFNPTLDEIEDVKTAVSEAVTNAIIHGYAAYPGKVKLTARIEGDMFYIVISDTGEGIENIEQAMEPLYTSRPELERSGMGFSFMEAFMDDLEVESVPGKGTTVRMCKKMNAGPWIEAEE